MKLKVYRVKKYFDKDPDNLYQGLILNANTKVTDSKLVTDPDGTIHIEDETRTQQYTLADAEEIGYFFMKYYDWNFLGFDKASGGEETDDFYSLVEQFQRFVSHNQRAIDRAFSDLLYEYNPIYNYDRNEVHFYNTTDTGGTTKTGTETHTVEETGWVERTSKSSNADAGTTDYGKQVNGSYANADASGTNAGLSWGGEVAGLTTQHYANTFTENGATPDKATESTTQKGVVTQGTTGSSASYEKEDRSNAGSTDTLTFDARSDSTNGTHKGQDGIKTVGNIGVVTSTAMVSEDILFRIKTNIADMFLEKFARETFFIGGDDYED